MEMLGKTILWIYGIIAVVVLILLAILIVKRIRAKKLEDFEHRDN